MVINSIVASKRRLTGSTVSSRVLISKALGITVRTTYIVAAIPKVEPLLIPGIRLLPNDSLDNFAKPLVQDLQ